MNEPQSATFQRRGLERLRHGQGELLSARDFRDQATFDDQRRWWHNRAMHEAFGVATGYRVSAMTLPAATDGQRNLLPEEQESRLLSVTVDAELGDLSIAYDVHGRELVLVGKATVAIPERNEGQMLVVHAKGAERSAPGQALECGPSSGSLPWSPSAVAFEWVASAEYTPADGVPLAEIDAAGIKLTDLRRFTAPLARPIMANGNTAAGGTPWQKWPTATGASELGFQVKVDTSTANFTTIPLYFAWLRGVTGMSVLDTDFQVDFQVMFEHIENPSTQGFLFRVGVLRGHNSLAFDDWALRNRFYVCWLGIECTDHPRPQLDPVPVPVPDPDIVVIG